LQEVQQGIVNYAPCWFGWNMRGADNRMSEIVLSEYETIAINDRGIYSVRSEKLNVRQIQKRRRTLQSRIVNKRSRIQDLQLEIKQLERQITSLEKQLEQLNSPIVQEFIRKEEEHQKEVQRKAQSLLHEVLGDSLYQKLENSKSFTFKANDGITYKIDRNGNVYRKVNKSFERLCIIRPSNLPLPDFILALFVNVREHPKKYGLRFRR
jgi:vacuolar-type H+-ATPase subunit I/STV1